jgi:hypothetical protein
MNYKLVVGWECIQSVLSEVGLSPISSARLAQRLYGEGKVVSY